MKKSTIIAVVAVLIIVVVAVLLSFSKPKESVSPNVATFDVSASVGDVVGMSNPFDVNVNPYQGYKNPFAQ